MTTVYLFSVADRGLMMLLLQPIKDDLHLTDTQLGFLTGIAFALFYATAGIPIARGCRSRQPGHITAFSIGLWFDGYRMPICDQLCPTRVGKNCCCDRGVRWETPTYSLVGDYFAEPTALTRAMSIYMLVALSLPW